jgi:hypothetical protein
MIIRGWKAYYGLENSCKSTDLWIWNKKKLLFDTVILKRDRANTKEFYNI